LNTWFTHTTSAQFTRLLGLRLRSHRSVRILTTFPPFLHAHWTHTPPGPGLPFDIPLGCYYAPRTHHFVAARTPWFMPRTHYRLPHACRTHLPVCTRTLHTFFGHQNFQVLLPGRYRVLCHCPHGSATHTTDAAGCLTCVHRTTVSATGSCTLRTLPRHHLTGRAPSTWVQTLPPPNAVCRTVLFLPFPAWTSSFHLVLLNRSRLRTFRTFSHCLPVVPLHTLVSAFLHRWFYGWPLLRCPLLLHFATTSRTFTRVHFLRFTYGTTHPHLSRLLRFTRAKTRRAPCHTAAWLPVYADLRRFTPPPLLFSPRALSPGHACLFTSFTPLGSAPLRFWLPFLYIPAAGHSPRTAAVHYAPLPGTAWIFAPGFGFLTPLRLFPRLLDIFALPNMGCALSVLGSAGF